MPTQPEQDCLVLADISASPPYLAGEELDHAQEVLADLLEIITKSLCPLPHISKLEGVAVFVYAHVSLFFSKWTTSVD